ncbi:DUF1364 domain-containing protein [Caballeronia sp. GAFFF2]|uniref:DUF1364 domain-containing protein n=1 Tax=Caballeronia sp. GAFFF2 TaxID=2921741 RepID=UPI002028D6B0|nr:DUF1364 domain-containing protein [Caballeronia sp. GAFFF2]
MKRSAFQRKPGKQYSKIASRSTMQQRAKIKARVKKPTVAEGSKYLAACRGERCFLAVPGVCIGSVGGTVVPAHSNQGRHGKGMGIKARHEFTVPGCMTCHAWIDWGNASREVKFATWDRAYERWEPVRARKMGLKEEEAA